MNKRIKPFNELEVICKGELEVQPLTTEYLLDKDYFMSIKSIKIFNLLNNNIISPAHTWSLCDTDYKNTVNFSRNMIVNLDKDDIPNIYIHSIDIRLKVLQSNGGYKDMGVSIPYRIKNLYFEINNEDIPVPIIPDKYKKGIYKFNTDIDKYIVVMGDDNYFYIENKKELYNQYKASEILGDWLYVQGCKTEDEAKILVQLYNDPRNSLPISIGTITNLSEPYAHKYKCICGETTGRIYLDTICESCNTRVKNCNNN